MDRQNPPSARPPGVLTDAGSEPRGLRLLFLFLVVAIGWLVFYRSGYTFKPAPDRPGWRMYEATRDGWTVEFPASWRARRISDIHHGSPYTTQVGAVALSNVDWPLERKDCGRNCWSPWVDTEGLPSNGIVVQIGWSYGGGFSCRMQHDTPLPVSFARTERSLTRDGARGTAQLQVSTGFIARLRANSITAWIGYKASDADLKTLEEIVRSISYEPISPAPPDTQNAC